jgi:hypothetical protein
VRMKYLDVGPRPTTHSNKHTMGIREWT